MVIFILMVILFVCGSIQIEMKQAQKRQIARDRLKLRAMGYSSDDVNRMAPY